jgi:outer membrane protein
MRYPLSLALALACLLLLAGAVQAELKVGVLDFQGIFQSYDGYDEAQKIFDKDMEAWEAEKQTMIQELMEQREQLEVQRLMVRPETLAEMESRVAQMEAELYQFEQEKFGPMGEAVRRNQELSEPIFEKIRNAVKEIAEEEDYDLVLDVTGQVLYVRPDMNMDEKVSTFLQTKG